MYINKHKKGQSTVEYIILVTAVIAVMIFFATRDDQGIRGQLNATLNESVEQIGNLSDRLNDSRAPDTSGTSKPNPVMLDPIPQ